TVRSEGATVRSEGATVRSEGATVRSDGATVRSEGATVRSEGATVRSEGATVRSEGATVRSDRRTFGPPDRPSDHRTIALTFAPSPPRTVAPLQVAITLADLKKFLPKSRAAWRAWLDKNHAASTGVWLVFAKKHTGLPTLSYEEAVLEALCFGWIDSLVKSIDDRFHMQMFTPRKPKSAWSATNKARLAKLMKAGIMATRSEEH